MDSAKVAVWFRVWINRRSSTLSPPFAHSPHLLLSLFSRLYHFKMSWSLMYLFKLKAYLSSIKGNYIPHYKAQSSPEWPLSVGRCNVSASVCGCQNNYVAVSVCVGSTRGGIHCFLRRHQSRDDVGKGAICGMVCVCVFLSLSYLPTAVFLTLTAFLLVVSVPFLW